ncbi:SDR family NAD(P)-dependent oxidoreductase [Halorhabdus salina]|uniref:SDR family NAD(P)-dependent oxidoreductase n=1 Tax=Halorhabdus salina TaxID=2750670 RepID=UPI0015EF6CAF|nr:SDR family NAD(P)-dependent oxidoreductase [Halorhabdus salina]
MADCDFAGQAAVVTDGASGVGRQTAIQFAEAGANVVVTDVDDDRSEDVGNETNEVSRVDSPDDSLRSSSAPSLAWLAKTPGFEPREDGRLTMLDAASSLIQIPTRTFRSASLASFRATERMDSPEEQALPNPRSLRSRGRRD